MHFNNQSGNDILIERLESVIRNDRVSHAYLLEGPLSADKKVFAESFIKGILCSRKLGENCGACGICDKIDHGNHEDLILITAESGRIKDADIVSMQDRLKTKPFGERNVVIIDNADTMTLRAQNRLLKTLEEPPGMAVIFLLSENMEHLAQTIQSRCVKYRINYDGSDGYDFMMDKASKIAEMAFRRCPFYRMKDEAEDIFRDDVKTAAFLDSLEMVYRDMLIKGSDSISMYKDDDIIKNIYAVEAAGRRISQGVSPAYSLKKLLLTIGG